MILRCTVPDQDVGIIKPGTACDACITGYITVNMDSELLNLIRTVNIITVIFSGQTIIT